MAARVLDEWREAERTLHLLPDDAPERPSVEAAVELMRDLYQRVTGAVPSTANALAHTRATIEETRSLLRAVRAKHEFDPG